MALSDVWEAASYPAVSQLPPPPAVGTLVSGLSDTEPTSVFIPTLLLGAARLVVWVGENFAREDAPKRESPALVNSARGGI